MCTEPYHLPQLHDDWTTTSTDQAPWLNLRTRKRVRDNRPAEDTIHSNTIRKLYDAQKRAVQDAPSPLVVLKEDEMDVDTPISIDIDVDFLDNGDDAPVQISLVAEPKQRSLHDFFARDRSQQEAKGRSLNEFYGHSGAVQQPVVQKVVLPVDFRPVYRPQQQWRQEGMLFGSESEM
jgi:hypothetical protein